MNKISERELARICESIYQDRAVICRHNPVGTRDETLLWMLLGCLFSYLSLNDNEMPCFTGTPDAKTYRQAILSIVQHRRTEDFSVEKHLDQMIEK